MGLRAQEREARAAEKRRWASVSVEENRAETNAKRRAIIEARRAAREALAQQERERQLEQAEQLQNETSDDLPANEPAALMADNDPDVHGNVNLDESFGGSDYLEYSFEGSEVSIRVNH